LDVSLSDNNEQAIPMAVISPPVVAPVNRPLHGGLVTLLHRIGFDRSSSDPTLGTAQRQPTVLVAATAATDAVIPATAFLEVPLN
jgi:hypothetical protein